MAAIQVTTADTNSFLNAARTTVRDSNGIPFVVTLDETNNNIELSKGRFFIDGGTYPAASTSRVLNNTVTAVGTSFTGVAEKLNSVIVSLYKAVSPTGNAVVKLYAHSGTYGSSSVPTGTALATSNTFDVSALTSGQTLVKFTFSSPYTLSASTYYVIVLEYTNGDATNYIGIMDNSTALGGNGSYYNGSWSSESDDYYFYLIGESVQSFYELDSETGETDPVGVSCVIDSTDVIHISWMDDAGKASPLRYTTIDLDVATPAFATPTSIVADIGENPTASSLYTAIAVDSNDVPHIVYNEYQKIGGVSTYVAMYVNKVGGSWNTTVQVEYTQGIDCSDIDIAIDLDNIPVISLNRDAANLYAFELSGLISTRHHSYGAAWSSWSTAGTGDSGTAPSIVPVGEEVYVFYEDASNDIVYDYTSSRVFQGPTTLETGTYNSVRAKWGFWVDNDSAGPLVETTDFYFDGSDAAASDPDGAWTDETNSDDGVVSTNASTSVTGSETTNYIQIEGTSATGITDDIISVQFRIRYSGGTRRDWTTIPQPSGGWTQTKIQGLEVRIAGQYDIYIYEDGNAGGTELINTSGIGGNPFTFSIIDIRVYTRKTPSELDYAFVDETASPDIYWNILSLGERGTELLPGTGVLTLTGYAPTVATPRNGQPRTGVITLTGYAPTVQTNVNVLPDTGVITLVGYEPTVVVTENQNITPDTGVITLTGYEPTIQTPRNVLPDTGIINLTGYEPTVELPVNVQADTGVISLTGYEPTIETPLNIQADTGVISLVGYAPTVSISDNQNVQADTGVINLVGYAPTVSISDNKNIQPDTGVITLTGYASTVDVTENANVNPDTGVITLVGYAPIVTAGGNVEVLPDTGVITLTGYEPTVTASDNKEVLPDTGAISLTGYEPTIQTYNRHRG
jgi:hypothetical protein